jgi:hypothetical protein
MSHHIDDAAAMPGVAAPGLRVGVSTEAPPDLSPSDAPVSVRVEVENAARPLRLSVYLDGDLVEACTPASPVHELTIRAAPGRHVVTARAVDAAGRWGGASVLIHRAA